MMCFSRWLAVLVLVAANSASLAAEEVYVRVNQIGYDIDDPKVAIAMGLTALPKSFQLVDATTKITVFERELEPIEGAWGEFQSHAELNFSRYGVEGKYFLQTGSARSPVFAIKAAPYKELPDQLLEFMRQQRCGYNPWVDAVCHSFDGRTVDGPLPAGSYVDARGGWHDAGDQLKYLLTSSNATAQMLLAYQLGEKTQFADKLNALGQPMPNGIADVLDEARWGLDWMLRLHPAPDQLYHQVADDRDHSTGFRLPQDETVDYGWGAGGAGAVYSADGKPQGLKTVQERVERRRQFGRAICGGDGARLPDLEATIRSCVRMPSNYSRRGGKCMRWARHGGRSARELVQGTVSLRGDDLGRRHGMGRGRIVSSDGR